MNRPKIYFVDGTAVAVKGKHYFKNAIAGFSSCLDKLQDLADIIILPVNKEGLYYLQNEGCGNDYGERYLIASQGVTACGTYGQDGSIGAILSPIMAHDDFVCSIQGIKDLLSLPQDEYSSRILLSLLFIGICGEMEGYLSSTIISLIQGIREVFLLLRDSKGFYIDCENEQQWREHIVNTINDRFQFQHIIRKDSQERIIYEKILGQTLPISQELIDNIKWRNKLAHKVPYSERPTYPSKKEIYSFIEEACHLVTFIDERLEQYKESWFTKW